MRDTLVLRWNPDKAISILLLSLFFLAPLLVSPWSFDHAILVKEAFILLVSGGLFLLLFLRATAEGDFSFKATPLGKPILFLLLFATLSLFKAVNLPAAVYRLALFLGGASLFFATIHSRLDWHKIKAVAAASVASAIAATLYAFLQYAQVDLLLPPTTVGLTSTLGNPNFLAEYLMYSIPLCLSLLLSSDGARWRAFYGVTAVFLFAGLLLCRTKSATLGLLGSLTVFAYFLRRRTPTDPKQRIQYLLPVASVGIFLAGLFALVYFASFGSPGDAGGILENYVSSQATYFKWRMVFYRDALRMALDNPLLGVGIGNFESTYPLYRSIPETLDPKHNVLDHAHNDYLELWAEVGLGGLIAFLWLLWAFFRKMHNAQGASSLGLGFTASIAGLSINSLFAFGLYNPVPLAVFWPSMALALRLGSGTATAHGQEVEEVSHPRPPPWAILVAVTTVIVLLYAVARPLVADANLARGYLLLRRGWGNLAVPALERAARLAPARLEVQAHLADAYFTLRRYKEAALVLDRYLKYDPYNYRIVYLLGLRYEQAGEEDAALNAYYRARRIHQLYSQPPLRIGVIRERRGDLQGAIEAYREAIRVNPKIAEASNNLAILLSSQGIIEEAIQVWENAAQGSPDDSVIAANLATAYRKKGDDRKALFWEAVAARLQAGRGR